MISVLDRQDSVGGLGGHLFDSGCNLSGLRKVHIELGGYQYENRRYPSLIKRIFLVFNNHPTDSNLDTKEERHPQYFGIGGVVVELKEDAFDQRGITL